MRPIDLEDTVFVSIDIQPREPRTWTDENILDVYKEEGFSLKELNDAEAHFQNVMVPNAVEVAAWARRKELPRIFVHWAGNDPEHRPHERFDITEQDHVVPKTERNAFPSSNFGEVLEISDRQTLLLVGGHTKGCLGDTATEALERGYRCVLVKDASFDCSIIRWPRGIDMVRYDEIVTAADILSL